MGEWRENAFIRENEKIEQQLRLYSVKRTNSREIYNRSALYLSCSFTISFTTDHFDLPGMIDILNINDRGSNNSSGKQKKY